MKKLYFITFLTSLCLMANAQSFKDLKKKNGENPFDEDILKVYLRHTSVSSKYTENYSGLTVNITVRNDSYEKWDSRVRYENPTLGDFLSLIPRAVKDVQERKITKQKWDNHAHGGGLIGWVQYYLNAVATDRLLISPGISGGDYIYGSQYINPAIESDKKKYDPYGYYLAAGPAIMATYLVNKKMWVDAYVNYDISFLKVKNDSVDPDYAKPSFISIGADVYTTKKLFAGIRLNQIIDKGINEDNSKRLDISAGLFF